MNYQLVSSLMEGVWMVDAITFANWHGIARQIMAGKIDFEHGKEMQDHQQRNEMVGEDDGQTNQKRQYVSITPLRGVMLKYNTMSGPVGTMTIARRLQDADNDPEVIAHVLDIDSGGGEARAIPVLTDVLDNLKKPVVGFANGTAASAAFWAFAYTDYKMAERKDTILGSVGTMIQFMGMKSFFEDEEGMIYVRAYADSSPQKNNAFEEALKGNLKVVKEKILNPHDANFMEEMQERFPQMQEKHLNGDIFNAEEVEGIMFDEIGNLQAAVQKAYDLGQQRMEDEENNTASNQTNSNIMKYKNVENVLGTLESSEEGTYLNDEQLATLDAALAENAPEDNSKELQQAQQEQERLQNELTTAQNRVSELEQENTTLREGAGEESNEIHTTKTGVKSGEEDDSIIKNDDDFLANLEKVEEMSQEILGK